MQLMKLAETSAKSQLDHIACTYVIAILVTNEFNVRAVHQSRSYA